MGSISFMNVRREPTVAAVSVSNAFKKYSTNPGTKPIINNLSMTVPRGKIYSLLGSSGCGKTTLLSCVIGTRRLDAGDIAVFGKTPGHPDSGVPGRRLGFMPQEIALHSEFSISEELHYFGKIFGMSSADVEDNKNFLINFLKLPPSERRINSLSGGQQRRVSFAVALVHNPELLILDEPTVGVDPLLRQSIWSHLVKLATKSGTSIIITTHFIEEARDSNRIGLMRNGRILMEDSPLALMKRYQTNILEEIVVELCLKDNSEEDTERDEDSITEGEEAKRSRFQIPKSPNLLTLPQARPLALSASALNTNSNNGATTVTCEPLAVPALFTRWPSLGQVLHKARNLPEGSVTTEKNSQKILREAKEKFERISALLRKNVLVLTRNLLFVFFLLLLPAFEICTVCMAVGSEPHGIALGVVNHELGFGIDCDFSKKVGCMMSSSTKYNTHGSCEFMRAMNPRVFELIHYEHEADALLDTKLGNVWGVMTFPSNFTEQLKERLQYGPFAGIEILISSRITFTMDMSTKLTAMLIQKYILEAFQEFMKATAVGCKFETQGVDLPIFFAPPVYGSLENSFTEFVAPGAIVAILYFFPICSTAMAMVMEKASGTLERTLVSGVRSQEIMISHFLTQLVLSVVQALLSFFIVFYFFKIEIIGSVLLAFTISIMVGISGITFGFFVAAVCRTELESVLMTIAAFMPNLVLSGVMWPLEGMPSYLRIVSYFLPCTVPAISLRSIVSRGQSLTHPLVWPGFVSTVGWILLYWIAALVIYTRKNKH